MTLQAGRLRHRISIQEKSPLLDSNGDVYQDQNTGETGYIWSTVSECWAAIEPLSGKEFIQSQALQSRVTGRVVIRWNHGIDAGMRVFHERKFNGIIQIPTLAYNIEAVLTDKESGMEYMTLLVSQGVNPDGA